MEQRFLKKVARLYITFSCLIAVLTVFHMFAKDVDAASKSGSNSSDATYTSAYTEKYTSISISGAPADATITSISVSWNADSNYVSDIDWYVKNITTGYKSSTYSMSKTGDDWWDSYSETSNSSKNITPPSGNRVNGTWRFVIKDTYNDSNADWNKGRLDSWSITVNYDPGYTLTVKSNVSGASVYLDNSYKGKTGGLWTPYSLDISNVYSGSYTVKVVKSGYETTQKSVGVYSNSSVTINPKRNTSITITPVTVKKGDNVTLVATLKDSGGGGLGGKSVKFYVDNSYQGAVSTDTGILGWGAGVAKKTISTSNLSIGERSVKVTFEGDSGYTSSERNDSDGLKVEGRTLTVKSNVSGANVYLDNSYKGTTSGLWAPYSLDIANVYGSHTVKLTKSGYETTEKSVNVTSDTSITIDPKRNTSITITPVTVKKGDNVTLVATLKDSGGGGLGGKSVRFYVDSTYQGSVTTDTGILGWGSGVAKKTISTSSLSIGNHSVKVTFAGDSGYTSSERTDSDGIFAVGPTLTVKSNVNGAKVYLDNVEKGTTSGLWAPYSLDITNVHGTHTVKLTKSGHETKEISINLTSDTSTTINLRLNTSITITPVTVKKGDDATLVAMLKDSGGSGLGGETVEFFIDGISRGTVTTDNGFLGWGAGVAKKTIPTTALAYGNREVKASFIGDSSYAPSEKSDSDGLVVSGHSLTIKSNVSGAGVYLDGSYKGSTGGIVAPYAFEISYIYGNHIIKLDKNGYEAKEITVDVTADQTQEINLRRASNITITPKEILSGFNAELEAVLKDSGGGGLGDKEIRFFVDGNEMGTVKTDNGLFGWGAGVAKISITTSGLTVGEHEIKAVFPGDNDYVETQAIDADGLSIIRSEAYIGQDAAHSSVPDYAQSDYPHSNNPKGICLATAGADILGYWDQTPYQGKTYWNLVDNGSAHLEDLSSAGTLGGTNHSGAAPVPGPNVAALVEQIRHEYYDSTWSFWKSTSASAIANVCNREEYGNNLSFTADFIMPLIGMPDFDEAKAEIDSERPFVYLSPEHARPAWGYKQIPNTDKVRVHANYGSFVGPSGSWVDWDQETVALIRIVPGGDGSDPSDHYEPNNGNTQATTLEPGDLHNYLQTHNFQTTSDEDWIRFSARSGQTYTIETKNLGEKASTRLYLYKATNLAQVVQSDTDGGAGKIVFDCMEGEADTYYIRVTNASGQSGPTTNYDLEIQESDISEEISRPQVPDGPANGKKDQTLAFSAGGAVSNLGHSLEFRFDWGDGSGASEWGASAQEYSFANAGIYHVKSQARCADHPEVVSQWSESIDVEISYCILTLIASPFGSGNITSTPQGVPVPGISEMDYLGFGYGQIVQLTANPTSGGWIFDHWEGVHNESGNTATITMENDQTVKAVFQGVPEAIILLGTPTGETRPVIGQQYEYQSPISSSNLGHPVEHMFDWGDGTQSEWLHENIAAHVWSETNPKEVRVTVRCQLHTGVASISEPLLVAPVEESYELSIVSQHNTCLPLPGLIKVAKGDNVVADAGSPFLSSEGARHVCIGWSGAGSVPDTGAGSHVTFTIDQNSSLEWHWKKQYRLQLNIEGNGQVEIEPIGDGEWYDENVEVNLKAVPDDGYAFKEWTYDITGSEVDKSLIMNDGKVVTAIFEKIRLKGDVDGNGMVGISDAVLALRASAFGNLSDASVNLDADVDGDGRIGVAESLYVLQFLANFREE